jgi:hypothetical protein
VKENVRQPQAAAVVAIPADADNRIGDPNIESNSINNQLAQFFD